MSVRLANTSRVGRRSRRGVATIWLLAGLPVLLVGFLFLLELGHLWASRVELENSLEAAALSAAKSWGTSGGTPAANWTNTARLRGQTLAGANLINGSPVVIGTNLGAYNAVTNPNENSTYVPAAGAPPTGNLVFGAVTDVGGVVTLDTTKVPNCGGATILADATGSGNLDSGRANEWGFAFQVATNPLLRIVRIEIDVSPLAPACRFNSTAHLDSTPDASSATAAVHDNSGNFQQDNVGFNLLANNMLSGQIVASYPNTQTLRLDFSAGGGDDGFAPGDRFRFSQDVVRITGGQQQDGDDVGGTIIRITFNNATTTTANLVDTTETGSINPRQIDPITGTFIVNTSMIPDLPQPATNAANNNGQSYVRLMGAGGATQYFGVRAQSVTTVPSLFGSYFGLLYATHPVTVDTTAIYDCSTGRTRLVRVDNYIHP